MHLSRRHSWQMGVVAVCCVALGACSSDDDDNGMGSVSGGTDQGGGIDQSGGIDQGGGGVADTGGSGSGNRGSGGEQELDAGTGEDSGEPELRAVTIRFKGMVGDSDFACGETYPNQGSTGVTASAQDLRFYVQDLQLVTEDGDEVPVLMDVRSPWQEETVALIDLENGEDACAAAGGTADTNAEITGMIPEGEYTGIVFTNGVPEELNHGDPTTSPLVLQAPGMNWSWLAGFRFMRAQMGQVAEGDAASGSAFVHVGSTACSGTAEDGFSCTKQNRNRIRLDGFNPDQDTIVVDIGALFADTELGEITECHSAEDSCEALLAALGVDFETGDALETQSVYRVE